MGSEGEKGPEKIRVGKETVVKETLQRFLDFSIESTIEALGRLDLTDEEISEAIRREVEKETTPEAIKKTKDRLLSMSSPKHQAKTQEVAKQAIEDLNKPKPKGS